MGLAIGATFAGYTILRLLGTGGMGEVYLAQHPRLPRNDALKILGADVSADENYRQRFIREADLAASLWHPHIVAIHDRGECEGRLWISMDYVDGTDAARMLRDHYPAGMPASDAIRIVTAVAEALDYSHARGLLHRDVRPANILLAELEDGERRILLSDFGVARDVEDVSGLTATNMTVGTVAYAAPEQLMALPMDGRADQYSLAATGYHLLTGLTLFPSSNPAVVIGQHLNAPPPTLAERRPYLAPLDAVFAKALAKDPNERFLRCVDFAHALAESNMEPASSDLSDMGTKTPVIPPVSIPKGPVDRNAATNEAPKSQLPHRNEVRIRRSRLLVAAALVLVAICVGAFFAVQAITNKAPLARFSLIGTLQLSSDSIKTTGLPGGYSCAGDRSDNDIGPGATVTVADETGKLIAKGAIESSYGQQGSCLFLFRVNEVPGGQKYYRVQVAQRGETMYTEAEAKAGINLSLGGTAPSPRDTAPPRIPTQQTETPEDPESASLAQLRRIANHDHPFVTDWLADRWVPQISSKRLGIVAEGTVWNNAKILSEHLQLRAQFPEAKLLWSGDWSTFDAPDFWVTIVGDTFPDAASALAWCTRKNLDRDHCYAKIVSTTHPVHGSTAFNP
ncbi:serine/threonine-protein kinase [Mycobacterium sp.]|uniref:serine/threonine-protein kinase n=1 Tax=Mycobacterium sp. TaxID=1785 RepID=UPI003F9AD2E8